MGGKFRGKGPEGPEANEFWVTISDMMLGLALVFITLFVLSMTGFSETDVQQTKVQMEVAEEIKTEMAKQKIEELDIDKMTGDITIANADLFAVNSWVLSESGKKLLDKIVPVYINKMFGDERLAPQIEYVIVQGHTDSQQFRGVKTKEEQFIKNMELSTKRANSVAEYMFKTNYDKKYAQTFREKLIVEGKSFNEPIIVNGVEDFAKSRRVVLKVSVKTWSISDAFRNME